jgi:hypothetical protein
MAVSRSWVYVSFAVLCELCANESLFLERIPFAQSSQRTAKLGASGWFLRRAVRTCTHSHLNAIIGSTFVARRAGTKPAPRATPTSTRLESRNVIGSVALTP